MTSTNSILWQKALAPLAVALAVVVAAVAAIVVNVNRESAARAYAEAAASQEARAELEAKAMRAHAAATNDMARAAEANARARRDELAAAKLANETAEAERLAAADNKSAAEANAKAEHDRADVQIAIRDAAKLTNETAKLEYQRAKELAAVERSKADAEATKLALEKLKADKIIAETKALELRKINYEALERDLLEWKLDLEERERALKPEKTIADLAWAGGFEDSVVDDKGNVTKKVKKAYDPEKDVTLSMQTRRLAKADRKIREAQDMKIADMRASSLRTMEMFYELALEEGRVIDAEFYKKNILSLYPDWKRKSEK